MPEALIYKTIRMRRKGQDRGAVHKPIQRRNSAVVDRTRKLDACYSERPTPQRSIVHKTAQREVYQ